MGLEASLTESGILRIDGVSPDGRAACWNESCLLEQQLIPGDRICAINGQQPPEGKHLYDYIKKNGPCKTLTIQHAEHLHVEVVKTEGIKVGLGLGYCKKTWCAYLEVENLSPGLFANWNALQKEKTGEDGVQIGDRIIEINGIRGTPDRLLDQMKRKSLQLVFAKKAWRDELR